MDEISIVGLDLAKSVFQLHGCTRDGRAVMRRKLKRSQVLPYFTDMAPCLVAMEACGGAHYWAREISALGHEVRLIPPAYVKPFVKRGKTDAIDAEAICEAVVRPTMRFTPVKSKDDQANAMTLKARELLVRQKTQIANAIRGHMAEMGIVAAAGPRRLAGLIEIIRDNSDACLPVTARQALCVLADQLEAITTAIAGIEADIMRHVRKNETLRRLTTIPGVGPLTAASIMAMVPDMSGFVCGRHFAAWLGLTPKPNASGGKERLGHISKMGNRSLRCLLVLGATCVLRHVRNGKSYNPWLDSLVSRKPPKVAAVALANKTARIIWAIATKGGTYKTDAKPNKTVAIAA